LLFKVGPSPYYTLVPGATYIYSFKFRIDSIILRNNYPLLASILKFAVNLRYVVGKKIIITLVNIFYFGWGIFSFIKPSCPNWNLEISMSSPVLVLPHLPYLYLPPKYNFHPFPNQSVGFIPRLTATVLKLSVPVGKLQYRAFSNLVCLKVLRKTPNPLLFYKWKLIHNGMLLGSSCLGIIPSWPEITAWWKQFPFFHNKIVPNQHRVCTVQINGNLAH